MTADGDDRLRFVGRVESPLTRLEDAPRQGGEGAPEAVLVFDEDVADGLRDVAVGDDVVVLTWLHRSSRDVLRVHPRSDPAAPPRGVFSTRSPDRPNPIGLHRAVVTAVERRRIAVRPLEAVDGTPVVDLKPVLRDTEPDATTAIHLRTWSGPWAEDDPDANLKADVAAYSLADPLPTLENMSRALDLPVGALARYVLVRWASGGAEGLLELGPSTVQRMRAVVADAEERGDDDARLRAYDVLRQQLEWLGHGLDDPVATYPQGGGGPRRVTHVAVYGVAVADGRVLLSRVAPGYAGSGSWTLPGGGVRHGEDIEDALAREVAEETGLDVLDLAPLGVDARHVPPEQSLRGHDVHWIRALFRMTVSRDRPPVVLEEDGSVDEAAWVPLEQLDHTPVSELVTAGLRRLA